MPIHGTIVSRMCWANQLPSDQIQRKEYTPSTVKLLNSRDQGAWSQDLGGIHYLRFAKWTCSWTAFQMFILIYPSSTQPWPEKPVLAMGDGRSGKNTWLLSGWFQMEYLCHASTCQGTWWKKRANGCRNHRVGRSAVGHWLKITWLLQTWRPRSYDPAPPNKKEMREGQRIGGGFGGEKRISGGGRG